ncbi:MAG TPA: hypothetical protein VG819_00290 [Rhizomicrobium sp.]|jgi:hypothetical protein|nr:hypothetical protein [Rhizomicrobium sp.]
MRRTWIGAIVTLAGVAFAGSPALAQDSLPAGKVRQLTAPDERALPNLAPGDDVAIACEAIERVADPSNVRVVLTIAAVPGEPSPGYKKILALNEKVTGSAVHLKVPNAPDLENHTVDLAVYVADGAKTNDCDGGKFHIVQTPLTTAAPVRNPG